WHVDTTKPWHVDSVAAKTMKDLWGRPCTGAVVLPSRPRFRHNQFLGRRTSNERVDKLCPQEHWACSTDRSHGRDRAPFGEWTAFQSTESTESAETGCLSSADAARSSR